MNIKCIKKGMFCIEDIGQEEVEVIAIKITKHYGPNRPVKVRFSDGHYEYYAPEDLKIKGE